MGECARGDLFDFVHATSCPRAHWRHRFPFQITCGPLFIGLTNFFRPNFRYLKGPSPFPVAILMDKLSIQNWYCFPSFLIDFVFVVLWFHSVVDLVPAFDHGWLLIYLWFLFFIFYFVTIALGYVVGTGFFMTICRGYHHRSESMILVVGYYCVWQLKIYNINQVVIRCEIRIINWT